MTKVKYHSTNQFRNVVKTIRDRAYFEGIDTEGKAIINTNNRVPNLTYTGTVKLHGTNASILYHEDGSITFHSKNNLLGEVTVDKEFKLYSDNAEFAQTMYLRLDSILGLKSHIEDGATYPIKVSGEWCGQGIQRGVGVSHLKQRSFFVFGISYGESSWVQVKSLPCLENLNISGIYSISDFKTYTLEIDFNQPEFSQNRLVELTEEVENFCPVSDKLGLVDNEGNPSLLGEGIVWTPNDTELIKDTGTWFKTKGKKHSVSKTKSVVPLDPEKLDSIQEFVDYAVTENRLQQGLGEVGLDYKLVGKFIGWVNKDINKEEGDVLEANNLTMKDVGKYISNKVRDYYLDKLNTAV